jgi:WD40 repeat protein
MFKTGVIPVSQSPPDFHPVPIWEYDSRGVAINHIALSASGSDVAISQWDGTIQILAATTGRVSYSIPFVDRDTVVACTRFYPGADRRLILSVGTSGQIGLFEYLVGSCFWSTREADTNTYACDFSPTGANFATGGKDGVVRIYDTQTQVISREYSNISEVRHSSRIYAVVYDPDNPNQLVTAGWDTRVLFWDVRQENFVHNFSGPNVCGDAIDVRQNFLLTAAWRSDSPFELWDMRHPGPSIAQGEWGGSDCAQVYSAKFSREKGWIAAGGSNSHSVKVFSSPAFESLYRLGYFKDTVNSVAPSPDGKFLLAASQDGKCFGFGQKP